MARQRHLRVRRCLLAAVTIACVVTPAARSDETSRTSGVIAGITAFAIPDPKTDTTSAAIADSSAAALADSATARADSTAAVPDSTADTTATAVADTAALRSLPAPTVQAAAPRRTSGGLRRAVGHFGSDLLYIATSPARMHRRDAVVLVAVLGTAAALYTFDGALYNNWIQRRRGERTYETVMDAGRSVRSLGLMGITIPVYAAGAATGRVLGFGSLERVSLELIETHLVSGTLRNSIKYLVGRDEPEDMNGPYFFHLGGRSFPSGHASTAFELATIVSEHARSWPVTASAYMLATLVAVERLDAGAHWPSDVFLGAATGTFVARAIVRRHNEQRAATEWGVGMREGAPTLELTWRF